MAERSFGTCDLLSTSGLTNSHSLGKTHRLQVLSDDFQSRRFPHRLFHYYLCMSCAGHAEHYFPQVEHFIVQLSPILAMGSSPCSPKCSPTCSLTCLPTCSLTCSSMRSSFIMSLCLVSTAFSCRHTFCFRCHRYEMDFIVRFYIRVV